MKRYLTLIFTLVFMITMIMSASAATNVNTSTLTLGFSSGMADCTLIVFAESGDEIDATMKLYYNGSICVGTWSDSAEEELILEGSCRAVSGISYTLTADVDINGSSHYVKDVSRTCP